MDVRFWILGIGYWILDFGCWVSDVGILGVEAHRFSSSRIIFKDPVISEEPATVGFWLPVRCGIEKAVRHVGGAWRRGWFFGFFVAGAPQIGRVRERRGARCGNDFALRLGSGTWYSLVPSWNADISSKVPPRWLLPPPPLLPPLLLLLLRPLAREIR